MSNVSDYREYWQSIYRAAYAEGREHWRPELATPPAFAEFMQSDLAPPPGSRVLEAGCGDGLNVLHLAAAGYVVTGVDISAEAIARAREVVAAEGLEVEFLCMDLVHDDCSLGDKYDLWVDIKTLHCLWEDADRKKYLAKAADALCKNGILFLNCALALADVREHFPEVFAALEPSVQAQADILDRDLAESERQGIRCETLDWYCHELEEAGFKISEARREASTESGWGAIIIARKNLINMNFIEITKDNWEEAIGLKPKRQQYKHLRGDVALHSLAKCYVFPGKYVPYIIEEDGKPIGCFRFRDYGRGVNLVSFFIDRKHQGRGLGRKAVEHFIEWVRQNYPKAREIELWVGPENSAARTLYEGFGFFYTGEVGETGDLYMELHLGDAADE